MLQIAIRAKESSNLNPQFATNIWDQNISSQINLNVYMSQVFYRLNIKFKSPCHI